MTDPVIGTVLATLAKNEIERRGLETLRQVSGGALNEIAAIIGNEFRLIRFWQELRIPGRAGKMAEKAGYDPGVVPRKVLAPLIEGAILEDASDEDMCEKWAALLANASRLDPDSPVLPSFPRILGQLTPIEVAVLDDLDARDEPEGDDWGHQKQTVARDVDVAAAAVNAVFDSLIGHGLVDREPSVLVHLGEMTLTDNAAVRISALGRRLVAACRPPTP